MVYSSLNNEQQIATLADIISNLMFKFCTEHSFNRKIKNMSKSSLQPYPIYQVLQQNKQDFLKRINNECVRQLTKNGFVSFKKSTKPGNILSQIAYNSKIDLHCLSKNFEITVKLEELEKFLHLFPQGKALELCYNELTTVELFFICDKHKKY
jgi:hypothetical protein